MAISLFSAHRSTFALPSPALACKSPACTRQAIRSRKLSRERVHQLSTHVITLPLHKLGMGSPHRLFFFRNHRRFRFRPLVFPTAIHWPILHFAGPREIVFPF
ncbi:hypothetical protein CPB86DRAFT_48426 [Serendipita vermifera]|nr:hypothetical protein CPB86DRAFT_48426 [Serendipita vermifera]